jgi:hypothetical protein
VNLNSARVFEIPGDVVRQTRQGLWRAGKDGYEAFVFWSGQLESEIFRIATAHMPHQTSFKTEDGLLVRVDGEALHRLNSWLYEHGEVLAVQVHGHPAAAYHSETDDAFPIVTTLGGLSIVVPHFARDGVFVDGTAVYRLDDRGWVEIEPDSVDELIKVCG